MEINLNAIEQTQEWRQSCVDGVGRPKIDFHTGWRTGPHFEDLSIAALGADAKALDVYKRSPVAVDVDDLEDGFLEIRVFVPELGTTETLRAQRATPEMIDGCTKCTGVLFGCWPCAARPDVGLP